MASSSSLDSLQRSDTIDEYSSELDNQLDGLDDLYDCETSDLLTIQQVVSNVADPAGSEPPQSHDSSIHIGSDLPLWKCFIQNPTERTASIVMFFSNRDEIEQVKHLSKDDAQNFINAVFEVRSYTLLSPKNEFTDFESKFPRPIDQTLKDLDHAPRMVCLRFLCKTCSHHALLPKLLEIQFSYDRTKLPLYNGGFADVWKGTSHNQDVAVKLLKVYQCNDQEKIRKVGG